MSKPLTALEELNKKSDYPADFSITREEIIAMHRREYEELIAKDKEELVRMLMGENKYEDAKFWYFYVLIFINFIKIYCINISNNLYII